MIKLSRTNLTAAAVTAAVAVGGTAVARGATDDASSTTTTAQRPADGPGRGGPGGPGGPGHGRGGPGAREDLAAVAKTLGVTTAKLRSAVESARPAGARPRDGDGRGRGRGDHDAERAAALATALGVDAAKVQEILDANRPQRGDGDGPPNGGPPADGDRRAGRPDDSALIAALARGLSKTEAEVRAALEKAQGADRAEHEARENALYAAVAKALGKDAADVKAAFEAARPKRG